MEKFSSKSLIVSSVAIAVLFIAAMSVFAAYDIEKAKQLTYPIGDLGNCKNFEDCRTWCNKDENIPTCNRFNIKHGLVTKEESVIIERMLSLMEESGLPGKCRGNLQCFIYCQSAAHFDECWDYARRHELFPPGTTIEDARRLVQYVQGGGKLPGNCKGDAECRTYCGVPNHFAECADFGEKTGIMTKEETDMMRRIAGAGVSKLPGDCTNKESCDTYCREDAHFDECVNFAEKVGMIAKEEVELARKTHGKTPGNCGAGARSAEEGKKACSAYCARSENQQACMDFAVQIGMITAEDAKELGGGGSLEDFNACVQFVDPETLKCFDALDKGVFEKMKAGQIPDDPGDLQKLLKGMKEVRACTNKRTEEAFGKLPPDGLVCLEKELGPNPLEIIKFGKLSCRQFAGTRSKIQACFNDKLQELDACLGMSCSEVAQCIKKFSGDQNADSSQTDKIKERINVCNAERINECLAKDCGEFNTCISKLREGLGEGKGDPVLIARITAKTKSCIQAQKSGVPSGGGKQTPQESQPPSGGSQPPSGGTAPPLGGAPSEIPITPELCVQFDAAPSCSFVGSTDSENYKLCKRCRPN